MGGSSRWGDPNHPTGYNQLSDLLRERERRIDELEYEIEGHITRSSHTYSRLILALDTLDTLQIKHHAEISSINATKDQLNDKLDRYIDVVNESRWEQEDMRDAVNRLIEKVEVTNDYSLWPHSHIHISCPLIDDPVPKGRGDAEINSNEEMYNYAAAMIARLRTERDIERRTRENSRKEFEYQIATLTARLARREAELEAFIRGSGPHRSNQIIPSQLARYDPSSSAEITDNNYGGEVGRSELFSISRLSQARDKSLEMEINRLSENIQLARSSLHAKPQLNQGAPENISKQLYSIPSSVHSFPDTRYHSATQSSVRLGHESHGEASATCGVTSHDLGQKLHEPEMGQNVSPEKTGGGKVTDGVIREMLLNNGPRDALPIFTVGRDKPESSIGELEQQVKVFAAVVDAFKTVKEDILDLLRKNQTEGQGAVSAKDTDSRNNAFRIPESETVDGPSQDTIPVEKPLPLVQQEMTSQERFDTSEFSMPSDESLMMSQSGARGNDDGEEAMELATPVPRILLLHDTPAEVLETPYYVDPVSVPLPPSYQFRSRIPRPSSVPLFTEHPMPESSIRHLSKKEIILVNERLDMMTNAMTTLQCAISDLQLQFLGNGILHFRTQ